MRQRRGKGGRYARKNTHDLRPADRCGAQEAVADLRRFRTAGQRGDPGDDRRSYHPPAAAAGASRPVCGDQPHRQEHQSDRPESQRRFCYEGGYPGTEVSDADDRDKNDRIGETVMAVTKILARRGGLAQAIAYVVNGDKTEEQVLTATQGCSIKSACAEMQDAKIRWNKTDGVQLYHIIQSFRPGEIEPELALEIAQEFVREHLPGYQAVIGIHTDREHIHAHIAFNSINQLTGEKYHSNARSYYQQIRAISDRLCREHGLSVIMAGESAKAISYVEWLRQSKGQPTFRSMLEADLRTAIQDANDLGHFFLIMEHMGYEVHHGDRLGFRLRGQERFQYPGRRDPLFTEDGIRVAIQGNLEQIEAGLRPVLPARLAYQPYRKHPRYSGFLALYVHYLYLLGKIEKRQYPPRMTPHLRQAVMRFERYQAQFAFLRENDITTPADMAAFEHRTEETLGRLTKQRTLLNVRKKKRQPLYAALADAEALEPSRALYEEGLTGRRSIR